MNNDLNKELDTIICEYEDFGVDIIPLLILEGKTDIQVYNKLLNDSKVDISKYNIVIGGCKNNISKFHEKYKYKYKYNYIALLDLDYSERDNSKIISDKIMYTHFYDMENYLTNIDVIYETYNDFKDISTEKLTKRELLNRMINIAYPSILANEYRLRFLEKYPNTEEIYSMDLFKPRHKNYSIENSIEDRIKFIESEIKDFIESKKMKFDSTLWIETKSYIDGYIINNQSYKEVDTQIQLLLKGRHVILIYNLLFESIFNNLMQGRRKDIFNNDLRKNLMKSEEAVLLLQQIDKNLNKMIS